ncbi:MAG: response regulator transcription factor [Bacteroidales bacterium]|nr:response regulator transcription factor [Bacteroidales bacterium]MBN2820460.1 response regulator transcription factor [Bacteroidales bacterium]
MASEIVTIGIVDDHAIFRDGLKSVLSQISEFRVIYEAETGKEFLNLLNDIVPDIVLMDISMPEMDGITATEKALKKYPMLKIITLSSYSDHVYYYKMIKAGSQGFVQKKSGKEELEKAIKEVYEGKNYFPQELLRNLIFKISHDGTNNINQGKILLSKRESEVLELICTGNTNSEIADKLCISPKTVDNHRTSLLQKTETKNAAHLVMFAIKNHLIEV